MTETLSYDPTPADQPEFSADEQNSLEVAEKLGKQESELYAGKFENAEEVENAYLELQKKLGSKDEDTEVDTLEETDEEVSPGVSLITDASNEYYANEGKLSQETMDKFGEMSSQDLVNAYMEIQANNPNPQQESPDLTDAEMNSVYNSAGGEKAYENMVSWASENLAERKLEAFNSIINTGDATDSGGDDFVGGVSYVTAADKAYVIQCAANDSRIVLDDNVADTAGGPGTWIELICVSETQWFVSGVVEGDSDADGDGTAIFVNA